MYSSAMTQDERFQEARSHWLRQNPGMTSRELIAKVGISETAYYAWESNPDTQIKAHNFMKFVRLTGYHPTWLLWEIGPKMLIDDERMQEFLDSIAGLSDEELERVVEYVDLLKRARPPEDL
jgi:DNA-binding XRE family transcriptional regulator